MLYLPNTYILNAIINILYLTLLDLTFVGCLMNLIALAFRVFIVYSLNIIVMVIVRIMSVERRLEESTTILMKVSLLLSSNTHLYLDVLLQLRCLDQSHLDLLRPLCRYIMSCQVMYN